MLLKQFSHEIKDLDEKQGIVVAYANAYNNEDSDGDISMPGSFNKTARENRKRIRVLKDHNPTVSLGVPLDLQPDDAYGLLTTTKFNLNKEVSRDMYTDIKLYTENNLNAELSIGFEIIQRNKSNKKQIQEYKLYEYSFLTSWAANELATVQSVKGDAFNRIKSHYGILELITKAYDMDYSDSRLKQIETLLKSLSDEPVIETTPTVEPINKQQLKTDLLTLFHKY